MRGSCIHGKPIVMFLDLAAGDGYLKANVRSSGPYTSMYGQGSKSGT